LYSTGEDVDVAASLSGVGSPFTSKRAPNRGVNFAERLVPYVQAITPALDDGCWCGDGGLLGFRDVEFAVR